MLVEIMFYVIGATFLVDSILVIRRGIRYRRGIRLEIKRINTEIEAIESGLRIS